MRLPPSIGPSLREGIDTRLGVAAIESTSRRTAPPAVFSSRLFGVGILLAMLAATTNAQTPKLEDRVAALERRLSLSGQAPSTLTLEERIAALESKIAMAPASAGERRSEEPPRPEVGKQAPPLAAGILTDVEMEGDTGEPSGELRDVVSGYAEFRYGKRPNTNGDAGVERFVLYFGHRFSSRLRFSSALEVEPTADESMGEARKVLLGQAYLEFLATPRLSVRSGILLAPIGIINEKHEPTSFNGVNRPLVETYIIPSCWRDAGIGLTGNFGRAWRYRAYVMGGLNASHFAAEDGIRGGRQGGQFFTNFRNPAQVGRVEYLGLRGLTLGASGYTSKSGFELKRINPRVNITEFDGQYGRGRFNLRGLFAHVWISKAGELNRSIAEESSQRPNIASELGGWYIEPAWNLFSSEGHAELLVFTRYERFNTQLAMPKGYTPLDEYQRDAVIVGTTLRPVQDVALKVDYTFSGNRSIPSRRRDGFRLGLGWYF